MVAFEQARRGSSCPLPFEPPLPAATAPGPALDMPPIVRVQKGLDDERVSTIKRIEGFLIEQARVAMARGVLSQSHEKLRARPNARHISANEPRLWRHSEGQRESGQLLNKNATARTSNITKTSATMHIQTSAFI